MEIIVTHQVGYCRDEDDLLAGAYQPLLLLRFGRTRYFRQELGGVAQKLTLLLTYVYMGICYWPWVVYKNTG